MAAHQTFRKTKFLILLVSGWPTVRALLTLSTTRFSRTSAQPSTNEDYWPERTHQEWTKEDDMLLWESRNQELDLIALKLQRGSMGVVKRLELLSDPKSRAFERLFVLNRGPCIDEGSPSKATLRPAKDCLQRIMWDRNLDTALFKIGYVDRFNDGFQEVSFTKENDSITGKERLFIFALPEHRIAYIKYRQRLVWHKELKLDRIHGSGSLIKSSDQSTPSIKIEQVIDTYASWLDMKKELERAAVQRVLRCFVHEESGQVVNYVGSDPKAKLKTLKEESSKFLNGKLSTKEFVDQALSGAYFGANGWGTLQPHDDQPPPIVDLMSIMPEEHSVLRDKVINEVASRTKNVHGIKRPRPLDSQRVVTRTELD